MKKKHIHTWVQNKKWVARDGFLNKLFGRIYRANISKCKCGEWYYITI